MQASKVGWFSHHKISWDKRKRKGWYKIWFSYFFYVYAKFHLWIGFLFFQLKNIQILCCNLLFAFCTMVCLQRIVFAFGKFTEKLLNTCLIATGLVGCLVLHWIQSSFSANSYKKACGHAHNEKEIRISKRRRYKISIISITCPFGLKL